MANNFITVKMDDGSEFLVQAVNTSDDEYMDAGSEIRNTVFDADKLLNNIVPKIAKIVKNAKSGLEKKMDEALPHEFELEFSIGLNVDANLVIASTEMSSGMTLRMKWNLKD
ncbi:MAG: hypothetical protein MJ147_10405 [Clostridia bacterium]|nr:hypothetical protein [Clostridia bacterium]